MTQEEKQLLLIDLCARLLYRVIFQFGGKEYHLLENINYSKDDGFVLLNGLPFSDCKLCLRPMSSMTKEEKEELESISSFYFNDALDAQIQESLKGENKDGSRMLEYVACTKVTDWLLEHHFDIHGLIEKGLAIEATEEMYNFKK